MKIHKFFYKKFSINHKPISSLFELQSLSFCRAENLVRLFYALMLFILSLKLGLLTKFSDISQIDSLWPVFWVEYTSVPISFFLIFSVLLLFNFICILNTNVRIYRAVFFIALLQFLAFDYSLGKINHSMHPWLFASFFLIFLPTLNSNKKSISITDKHNYLTVVWFCIFISLFFYSLSGFWKVYRSLIHILNNEPSILSLDVFARQISYRLLQTDSHTLLGPFFIKNYFLGWIGYLSSIYIELFSFLIAFRPSLHRIWGILLVFFHIGVKLTMDISFTQLIIYDALFLICSPFSPNKTPIKTILNDLPLLSFFKGKTYTEIRTQCLKLIQRYF